MFFGCSFSWMRNLMRTFKVNVLTRAAQRRAATQFRQQPRPILPYFPMRTRYNRNGSTAAFVSVYVAG